MKTQKNILALSLIITSIVLLVALQVFWIHSSYKNEISELKKEAHGIFRSTVFQLRDSVFFSSVAPTLQGMSRLMSEDSALSRNMNVATDTVYLRKKSSAVQVFISSSEGNDSLLNALKPLTQRIRTFQGGDQNFTIRIAADSIPLDTLQLYFETNLLNEKIKMHPQVSEVKFSRWSSKGKSHSFQIPRLPPDLAEPRIHFPTRSIFNDSLPIEPVRLNPGKLYAAMLTGVRMTILKKITPQILFSFFLTFLTTAAFVIMYRSIRAQQRLMELKNDFISNITHELKTPVTTVGVALEALKSFKGLDNPALTEEYLEIAQNELNRLNILTDKILKTSSFENNGIEYNAEPVELDKLVEQVLDSMKLVFEKQQAKINFDKEGAEFLLMGSSAHLTSVVYNLLDNALKYSREIPEIEVRLLATADKLTLTVKDQGIGISPEYRKKVFEKFFRVPTGDVHNIKGYGLGLSYVESVVKSHKGTIEVQSEPGSGSSFIIILPK